MSTLQAAPAKEPALSTDAELARKCLYYMVMMREMEDRIERKLYRQGKIVGGVYVGRGQEAIPVGTALLSRPEDVHVSLAPRYGAVPDSRRSRGSRFSRSTWAAKAGSRAAATATCTWAI